MPKVLLGLGATCLLVAALVFLAVTWSVLGVGGRTATLVALTLVMGGLTALSARHALRGAVEAMGLVTIGLAALDVVGARSAGWFGDPSDAGFATVVGALLVGGGLAATAALLRTPARGFTAGELAAGVGALVVFWGISDGAWADDHVRALVATVVLGLLAAAVWTRRQGPAFLVAAIGTTVVAVLAWLTQAVAAVVDASDEPSVSALWGHLAVWPVLAAAAVGVVVAVVRLFPELVRVLALAVSVVLVAVALTLPAYDEGQVVLTLTLVAAVLVLATAVSVAPRPWAYAGLGALTLGVVPLLATGLGYVAGAAEAYGDTAALAWSGTASTRVGRAYVLDGVDHPWLLPVITVTLLLAALAVGRLVPDLRTLPRRHVAVAAAGVLCLGLVATVLSYPVPVWTVLAGLLAAAAAATALGTVRASRSLTGLGAALVLVALPLSFADEALTTGTLAVTLVLAAAVHVLRRDRLVEEVAGGAVPFVLAGLVWSAGAAYDVDGPWAGLVGLLLLGGLVLGRGLLDRDHSSVAAVAVVEACSGLAALPAGRSRGRQRDRRPHRDLARGAPHGGRGGRDRARPGPRRPAPGGLARRLPARRGDVGPAGRPRRARAGGLHPPLGAGPARRGPGAPAPSPGDLDPEGARRRPGPRARAEPAVGADGPDRCPGGAARARLPRAGGRRRAGPLVGAPGVRRGGRSSRACCARPDPWSATACPRWALIGGAGVLLIALGVTWEARMRDARRAVDYVRSLR